MEELYATQKLMLDILESRNFGLDYSDSLKLNREQREELILQNIKKVPLSIGQVWRILPQIKRPTLKSDLKRLVSEKKLKKKGKRKGVLYWPA